MRTSPAIDAPRVRVSAPLPSVSSRFEKPPEPRSKTPCTRQSVPLLPGLEMQVPSARRIVRPGQCRPWLADFAASRRSIMALRKSTALSRRYLTAGLLRVLNPSIPLQPAASRSDRPPGPWAKARRSNAAPGLELAAAFDRPVLDCQMIKIEIGRQTGEKRRKFIGVGRCCVLHLPPESYRFEPSPALF